MSTTPADPLGQIEVQALPQDKSGLFANHPAGLRTLFFTEMWERFSYYGMRALLMLFMPLAVAQGGLGFSDQQAGDIYGTYTMAVYLGAMPGGYIADNFLGQKLAVLVGGSIIALGHFTMAIPRIETFYAGLVLIVIGTGLLKPNVSTMLGTMYEKGDPRRDAGFSIFYMGVNVGATLSPIVCGFLAQSKEFKNFLSSMNIDPNLSWHFGFAAAGVGMIFGLLQFIFNGGTLKGVGEKPARKEKTADNKPSDKPHTELTTEDWKRLGAIGLLFWFSVLFWSIYEQGGSSLNLFADRMTNCSVAGWEFPSTWLQSFQAVFVIIFAPIFAWFWVKLGDKNPSSPTKFVIGLLLLGLGITLMVPAAMLAAHGKVSPLWLIVCYFLQVMGELCLSPVGLSTVTKLAPAGFLSLTMGLWYLSNAIANKIAGSVGGQFKGNDFHSVAILFGSMGAAAFLGVIILTLLVPTIKKLMSGVR